MYYFHYAISTLSGQSWGLIFHWWFCKMDGEELDSNTLHSCALHDPGAGRTSLDERPTSLQLVCIQHCWHGILDWPCSAHLELPLCFLLWLTQYEVKVWTVPAGHQHPLAPSSACGDSCIPFPSSLNYWTLRSLCCEKHHCYSCMCTTMLLFLFPAGTLTREELLGCSTGQVPWTTLSILSCTHTMLLGYMVSKCPDNLLSSSRFCSWPSLLYCSSLASSLVTWPSQVSNVTL